MPNKKYLDYNGVAYLWEKIKSGLSGKVDKVDGKSLSSNDYTSAEKTKLAGIESGAEANVLEGIQKNGTTVTITNKIANISVPTATSDLTNDSNFAVDANYVHTDNNYTTTEKTKLAGIDASADVNVIETVKVNGAALTVDANKAVNVTVPTATSALTNDSGFITTNDIPEGAAASTTTPVMDGTASTGTELAFARGDHVHPTDTSRASASDLTTLSGRVDDLETVVGTGGSVDTKIANAVADLDSSVSATSNQAISAVTITDGKITASSKITIPTNNNQLTNGAGYQTASDVSTAISGKADSATTLAGYGIADAYTKTETQSYVTGLGYQTASDVSTAISSAITTVMDYKGTKATVSALPSTGNKQGDVWHVTADNGEYAWNGTTWEELGSTIDLSGYQQSSELISITNAEIDTITAPSASV